MFCGIPIRLIIPIVLVFLFFPLNSYGGVDKGFKNTIQKPTVIDRKLLDVNQISAYFRNDGEFYSDHSTTGPGFEWPKGSGNYAIYSAGLWIGGKVATDTNPSVKETRVATVGHFGSEYRPGKILSDGSPDYYTKPEYRYYKVRPKLDGPNSNPDFAEWPVDQGAPYHDVNGNGIYEPTIDKPALIFPENIIYPDMMLFAVYNDANPAYHTWIWGRSKPLGVEVRQLNWAFDFGFIDAHFLKFQIYNKSNKVIDSLYLTFWADPDIGDAPDDYVGCDTTFDSRGKRHNLGYCYNGDNIDGPPGYGSPPPAVGVKLFQGPLIYTGSQLDTAVGFGKKWIGFKNGDLSGFNFYCNPGMGECLNTEWFDPSLYEQTYNIMKGLTRLGKPQICQGDTVKFMFAGDPVTGAGCINSSLLGPSDLRFTMPTGPITMAPGDSQEVIYAVFVEKGINNLNSITQLRNTSELLKSIYDNNFENVPYAQILLPNYYNPPFLVNVKVTNAVSVTADLIDNNGVLLGSCILYDDGAHNDELANDNLWGNWLNSNISEYGASISLMITYNDGKTTRWKNVINGISTSGRIKIVDFDIVSDAINQDKRINPGEDVRFKCKLLNNTSFIINDYSINPIPIRDQYIHYYEQHVYKGSEQILIGEKSSYVPDKYYSFEVAESTPAGYVGNIIFQIYNTKGNIWYDTLRFVVEDYIYQPIDTIASHITGNSDAHFKIKIVDYLKLKEHFYKIEVKKFSVDDKRYNLINTTTNDTLLYLKNFVKSSLTSEHDIPIIDGFKVYNDDMALQCGIKKWNYPINQNYWFSGVRIISSDQFYPEAYSKNRPFATSNPVGVFGSTSAFERDQLRSVKILFSNTNTQKAYRYISGFATFPPHMRRIKHPDFRPFVKDSIGSGFLYQDFEKYPLGNPIYGNTVPFTVWETDKEGNITRQLDVGIIERNDTLYKWSYISPTESVKTFVYYGNIDGKWNPSPITNYMSREGDELLLIFGTTYTDTPKTIYTGGTTDDYRPHFNLKSNVSNIPIKYLVWMRRINPDTTFNEGEVLEFIPYYPVTENDVYIFKPPKLLGYKDINVPDYFKLYQNYPNPFNSTTTIRYYVAERADVEISVYDILGRKIQTLVNEQKTPGTYQVIWDGRNKNGITISSGVYLVKFKAGNFTETKKILLMR